MIASLAANAKPAQMQLVDDFCHCNGFATACATTACNATECNLSRVNSLLQSHSLQKALHINFNLFSTNDC